MGQGANAWARTTAIVVTHHSSAVIAPCLESVKAAARIIVIDNESADDTLAIVRANAPGAEIIENKVGVGYGNAASQGLALVDTEFALLMNPDAEFVADGFAQLMASADANPDAGLLSPLLIGEDDDYDRAWNGPFFRRASMPSDRSHEPRPEGPFCTWVVSGAVNLVRMEAMRKVGFFEPAIFLYYEDDDLCMRLMNGGYRVMVDPCAVARHIGGGSIGSGWDRHWEKYYHIAWSRLYFEAKYNSAAAAWALGLRQLLRFGPKGLGYRLTGNRKKGVRDLARFSGALAYLMGKAASKTTSRARPEVK